MDAAAAAVRHRAGRDPPAQSDREIPLHLGHRPHLRRREPTGRRSRWRRSAIDVPAFRAPPAAGAIAAAAISASASRRSPSAPATARRPSRRAAWASRRAGRRSSWRWTRPARSRCGSAPARTARGCARRSRQLVADELGVAPDRIKVIHGDTDRTPYGWGTFASRSLVIAGGASVLAARKVRAKLKTIASHLLEAAADDIVLDRRRRARRRHGPRRCRSRRWRAPPITRVHLFKGEIDSGLSASATYDPPGTFSNACHAAIVEVDAETGGSRSSGSSSPRMPAAWSIR